MNNEGSEARRLKVKFSQLLKQVAEQLDKALLIVLTGALQKLLVRITADDNQGMLTYTERLLDDLALVAEEKGDDLNGRIEEVLWEYNFNSRLYFLFYIKRIAEREQMEDTIVSKLELLAFELKKVNQRLIKGNVCYTTTYSSLPDIVGNWLLEEIAFLRTRQQLTITFSNLGKPLNSDFKIALDLSVAQFSCLVRGLIEKKLILNSNLTELANFLSNSVITKRSENISVGSFRKKYYNMEESTKKSVIDMLNKVIDWLLRN